MRRSPCLGAFQQAEPMPARRSGGFTLPELIIVMVIGAILAATVLPKLTAAINMRDEAWHDELQAALRFAQKGAVARRRLTCVAITNTTVTISMAAANPATACTVTLNGPDGDSAYATADDNNATTSVSPSGTIYFQPDGRVTSDGAGATASTRTISVSGASAIVVYGETGYVE